MSRRERQRRRRRNRGSPAVRAFLIMLSVCVAAIAIGALGVVGWVVDTAASAPDIGSLKPRDPGQVSEVFAADGTRMGYIHSDTLRTVVHGNRIPLILKRATVAIEDRRFWSHGGIDPEAILRAAVKDVFNGGRDIQGGSTLTMQLVRNIYLPDRLADTRSLKRKIIEAKLADELERHHSKPWILDQYLNDVDYGTVGGETAIGVGAGSQLFFDKPVYHLSLAQAALLAGLPQAPSEYNPFTAPKLAKARRHDVLTAMVQSHYITYEQAVKADHAPLQVKHNATYSQVVEPYAFDYVKRALIQRFGLTTVERGGLKVYTTIDLKKQQQAREAILRNEGQPGDPAAALVSIDPHNGHIEAMATSSTYNQTNFDYATQSHRQTGSAFKVFVLMTLIHDYHGDPNQTFYNSHELLPGWLPSYPTYHVQTAEHSYLGTISVAKATTESDNTVFAQLDVDVTPEKVRQTAYNMGITSHLDALPAEGIGGLRIGVSPLEMSDAYATVANGGNHLAPTAITKVVFPDGSVVNMGDPKPKRVFSDGEAYAADQVLKTVITSGTGTAANYGCPAAGKTGTTSNYTDAWFVGYTPQLSTAVWVGYPNSTESMNDVNGLGPGFGGTLAAPIWHDFMSVASNGYCSDFPSPSDPFHGTAFTGHYAVSGNSKSSFGGTGSGSSSGTGFSAPANPYSNPTLYAQPPANGGGTSGGAATSHGPGAGTGKPSGSGHGQGGGGGGGGGHGGGNQH
jgi:penicillin-binding protein 1A